MHANETSMQIDIVIGGVVQKASNETILFCELDLKVSSFNKVHNINT